MRTTYFAIILTIGCIFYQFCNAQFKYSPDLHKQMAQKATFYLNNITIISSDPTVTYAIQKYPSRWAFQVGQPHNLADAGGLNWLTSDKLLDSNNRVIFVPSTTKTGVSFQTITIQYDKSDPLNNILIISRSCDTSVDTSVIIEVENLMDYLLDMINEWSKTNNVVSLTNMSSLWVGLDIQLDAVYGGLTITCLCTNEYFPGWVYTWNIWGLDQFVIPIAGILPGEDRSKSPGADKC